MKNMYSEVDVNRRLWSTDAKRNGTVSKRVIIKMSNQSRLVETILFSRYIIFRYTSSDIY